MLQAAGDVGKACDTKTMNDSALDHNEILTPEQLAKRLQVGVNWVYEKSRSRGEHSVTAALTGLRKGEVRGLCWGDFDGRELSVRRSVWNSTVNEPKTNRSKAPIPVVRQLADALESHRLRIGKLAQPGLPIFQAGNGKPLNLDNLVRRVVVPALTRCTVCGLPESEHGKDGHEFNLDTSIPSWHGWHSFRRGLATTLHQLGVDDKTIQAILRHSNIGVTMNVYVKSVAASQVNAMDALSAEMQSSPVCNDLATPRKGLVN